ncbi:MAG: hypothetical protein J6T62_11285, partial [Fibrobacter sp.]|nr:hypothetical protein [Fibrobacter sp.]
MNSIQLLEDWYKRGCDFCKRAIDMRSRVITLLILALLPMMLWASGNTVGRGDLSVSFEASHSNTQMVDTIHIKGPLGSLSAEMLLPKGFDRENGRCE